MWIYKWSFNVMRSISPAKIKRSWLVQPAVDGIFLSDDDKQDIIQLTNLLIEMHQLKVNFFIGYELMPNHGSVYCRNWHGEKFTIYLYETSQVVMQIAKAHDETIKVYVFRSGDWIGELLDIMQGIKISKFQKLKED